MTIDARILEVPGRSAWDFHRADRHRVQGDGEQSVSGNQPQRKGDVGGEAGVANIFGVEFQVLGGKVLGAWGVLFTLAVRFCIPCEFHGGRERVGGRVCY